MSHRVREDNFTCANQYSQLVMTLIHEGGSARRHLVHDNTEGPPVHCEAMTLHVKDLWRQILGSTAETECLLVLLFQELSETEVRQTYVAPLVHQHILRLQVSMHNLIVMQIAKGQHDLCRNEFYLVFLEPLRFVQVVVNIATRHILQEEVDS